MACCDTNGCNIVDKCYSHTSSSGCASCNGSVGVDSPCSSNCSSHTLVTPCTTCNGTVTTSCSSNCSSHATTCSCDGCFSAVYDKDCTGNCSVHSSTCTSGNNNDYTCYTNGNYCSCNLSYGTCAQNCRHNGNL